MCQCICEHVSIDNPMCPKHGHQRVPHKHAALIKAWADGAKIQCADAIGGWYDTLNPTWDVHHHYRIKPEPKPDIFRYAIAAVTTDDTHRLMLMGRRSDEAEIKLIFDGETGKLKSVCLV